MDRDHRRTDRRDRGSSRGRGGRRENSYRGRSQSRYRDSRYGRRSGRSRSASRSRSADRDRRRRSRSRSSSGEGDRRRQRRSHRDKSRSPSRGRPEDKDSHEDSKRREASAAGAGEEEGKQETMTEEELSADWKGPRAATSEDNGEISCSVEETNRIRKLLGLKPLTSGKGSKKELEAVENSRKLREEQEAAVAKATMQAKIEKARNRRLLNQKLVGKSLGEQLEEEEDLASASKWIERSRRMEEERKRKAQEEAERAKKAAKRAPAYGSKDLAGMKIAHDIGELEEDSSVILTLKDSSVLRDDGEDEDELENINLAEMQRTQERKERERRSKLPAYSGFEDDDFKDPEAALANAGKPKLLSQYDETKGPKKEIVLGEKGTARAEKPGSVKKVDLEGRKEFSLTMDKMQAVREYYTQEEMAKFAKPKKLRKKKLRKKAEEDEEEADVAAVEAATEPKTAADHGSRAATQAKAEQTKREEEKRRKEAFSVAKQKSEAAAAKLRAAPAEVDDGYDEDADLLVSLERSRRLALKAQARGQGDEGDAGPRSLAERVKAMAARQGQTMDMTEDSSGRKIVFSQTTEFSRRLQAQMREKVDDRADVAGSSKDAMELDEETKGEVNGGAESGEEEEKVEDNWGQDLPLAGQSMAAALQLLSYTGDLRDGGKEEQAGRAKDERVDLDRLGDPAPDIKLEYRDEYGRLLTLKEAYRQLSYRFHGQKPGKKKQDKRLKKIQEEIKAKKIFSGEFETRTMGALKQQQEQSGQAYIVLSGTGNSNANDRRH